METFLHLLELGAVVALGFFLFNLFGTFLMAAFVGLCAFIAWLVAPFFAKATEDSHNDRQ